jgi:ABC-2 type transport system permease protein
MQKIWTILKKEFTSHLDNASGYLLLAIFLILNYYFFFKTFFISGEISTQILFSNLSWILCIFVAAITMSSFALERDKMTIEYLLTKPLTTIQLLLGKVLGNFCYILIPLALTLPTPFLVSTLGSLDWGEVWASYFAAILLTFSLTTIGVAISATCKKPVVAFILTAAILLFLAIISSSFFAINLDPSVAAFLANFGLLDHYYNLLRGVLDLNDCAYFIFLSLLGLTGGYLAITLWRFNKVKFPRGQIIGFIIVILSLGYLSFATHPLLQLRLDLTNSKRYTLSPVTKDILQTGADIKIEVYLSDNLPSQFQGITKDIRNTLADYARVAGSKVALTFSNPKGQEQKLSRLGINPTPFSIVSGDSFQQQVGYAAAVLTNSDDTDKTALVDFLQTSNIDYELTKAISQIKSDEKPLVAYLQGSGEPDFTTLAATLTYYLSSEMIFVPLDVTESPEDEEKTVPDFNSYQALIITQPSLSYSESIQTALKNYYDGGGSILYLASGNQVDPQTMMVYTLNLPTLLAATNQTDQNESLSVSDPLQLFTDYGLTIDYNLIADYQNYSLVSDGGFGIIPYQYWIQAQPSSDSSLFGNLPERLNLFWPSSLTLDPKQDWQILYQTSKLAEATASADVISALPNLEENNQISLQNTKTYPLVALRTNDAGGKLLVVSNSLFLFDDLLQGGGQTEQSNLVFAMVALENLSSSINLSQIQARQLGANRIPQGEDLGDKRFFIQYGTPFITLILLAAIFALRVYRRHQLRQQLEN